MQQVLLLLCRRSRRLSTSGYRRNVQRYLCCLCSVSKQQPIASLIQYNQSKFQSVSSPNGSCVLLSMPSLSKLIPIISFVSSCNGSDALLPARSYCICVSF